MKDLGDMTQEELREWDRQQREESRRRFADQPPVRISRAKRDEYADFYGVERVFRVVPGLRTSVVRQPAGERTNSRVRGMRRVADAGPDVVLLELDSGEAWGIRRADRPGAWDPEPETFQVVVEHATVPVLAWQVDTAALADESAVVRAPEGTETWTVRTASLGVE